MAQITHLSPGATVGSVSTGFSGFSDRQTYPIVTANGRQFVVVPLEDYRNLKANKSGWFLLAGLGGASVIALLIALIYRPNPQPMVIEKPVVVEKQVPVYKNCLLVCR